MEGRRTLCVAAVALALATACGAYYIPGTYPQEFLYGETLNVHVNSLKSYITDIPREYYTLPYCKPREGVHRIESTVNPGTILLGLRIENSPYDLSMMVEERTRLVCTGEQFVELSDDDADQLKSSIDDGYRINMILDNMPVTTYDLDQPQVVRPGFDIGFEVEGKYFVFNHLVFNILVHETFGEYAAARAASAEFSNAYVAGGSRKLFSTRVMEIDNVHGGARMLAQEDAPEEAEKGAKANKDSRDNVLGNHMYMVVGFEVMPCSIKRDANKPPETITCDLPGSPNNPTPQEIAPGEKVVYTYDVYWQMSAVQWASRWDAYLRMPGGRVHWFGLANSVLIVVVLAAVVAMILFRTVRRDLVKYEELLVEGGAPNEKEEAGWKMVAGDVFRPPTNTLGLAVAVGTGAQIFVTTVATMAFAVLGFLSPASRGALLTAVLVLYFLLAAFGGAAAVWLLGAMQQNEVPKGTPPPAPRGWVAASLRVACSFPALALGLLFVLNLIIKNTGSAGAVPLGYACVLAIVWFAISVPSTLLGGLLASRAAPVAWPTRTNQIPRHVPPPASPIASRWALYLGAGLLPFGTLFIELYFALSSIWQGFYYYLFGFLFVVGLLTFVIVGEVSLVTTYVQLCHEDYHWWWASFHRGGSVALYVGMYAFSFLITVLNNLHAMAVLLYIAYMAVVVLGMYLAMGAVGFAVSLWLTYAMFSSVKAD